MLRDTPKQAFATREAHEALLDLKNIIDQATKTTHTAELESFHEAVHCGESSFVRSTLQTVLDRLKSPIFDAVLSRVRKKLETAASIEGCGRRGAGSAGL